VCVCVCVCLCVCVCVCVREREREREQHSHFFSGVGNFTFPFMFQVTAQMQRSEFPEKSQTLFTFTVLIPSWRVLWFMESICFLINLDLIYTDYIYVYKLAWTNRGMISTPLSTIRARKKKWSRESLMHTSYKHKLCSNFPFLSFSWSTRLQRQLAVPKL